VSTDVVLSHHASQLALNLVRGVLIRALSERTISACRRSFELIVNWAVAAVTLIHSASAAAPVDPMMPAWAGSLRVADGRTLRVRALEMCQLGPFGG